MLTPSSAKFICYCLLRKVLSGPPTEINCFSPTPATLCTCPAKHSKLPWPWLSHSYGAPISIFSHCHARYSVVQTFWLIIKSTQPWHFGLLLPSMIITQLLLTPLSLRHSMLFHIYIYHLLQSTIIILFHRWGSWDSKRIRSFPPRPLATLVSELELEPVYLKRLCCGFTMGHCLCSDAHDRASSWAVFSTLELENKPYVQRCSNICG